VLYAPQEKWKHRAGLHLIAILFTVLVILLLAVLGGPWPRLSTSP
jgi:hypothetical protein